MSDQALILRDDARLCASYTEHALALREEALSIGALVGKVSNDLENNEAAAAMTAIRTIKRDAEVARKAAKEPVLDFGRRIDAAAKDYLAPLDAEEIRLANLIGDFKALELARQRAAESAAKAELTRIEREREAALAQAKSEEQRNEIIERAHQEVQAAKPEIVVSKPKGQIVKEVWEVQHIDQWTLAKAHPELVSEIVFDMRKVKAALDILGSLPGVMAKKVIDVSARAKRQPLQIEA